MPIAEKRRDTKDKGEKERYPFECRVLKNSKEDKKAFLSNQCKEIEENKEWKRLGISSRKSEIPKEHFMQRWVR